MANELEEANVDFDETAIIEKCQKFLERASSCFSGDITDQERALEIAGGNFWTEETKKRWAVYNEDDPEHDLIPVLNYNNISTQVNSIASPFSRSPFHINILDKENNKDLQDLITQYEGSNIVKNVYNKAFARGVTCSCGYVVVGTKMKQNRLIPDVQFLSDQSVVAFDPDCETCDGSDAEEGAIVKYISVKKARRQYGEDVAPYNYPEQQAALSFQNCKCWGDKENKIQLVNYFVKEDVDGNTYVKMYTICGDKVVEKPILLPTSYIPIVRFAGYNDYSMSRGQVYTGYVQKMMPTIEMMCLALTMQASRMRKCSSVRFIAGKRALKNCEGYFTDFEKSASMGLIYNDEAGVAPPQIIQDTFQTGDIGSVMDMTRQTMMDMSGVNLAGIQQGQNERTAYEVMQQQVNSESNVQELFLNAEQACHTLGNIVLGVLNEGNVPAFTLEGGPSVITSQMKERAEIQAIQPLVPPEQLPLLAIRMADTIDSNFGKTLSQDIKANTMLKFTEGQDLGGMMSACEQMKQTLDATMQELENTKQENQQLMDENKQLNLAMQNQQLQYKIDLLKWQADMKMNEAQLAIDNEQAARKLEQEDAKIAMQARQLEMKANENAAKVNSDMQREHLKLQTDQFKAKADIAKINAEIERDQIKAQMEAEKLERDSRREAQKFAIEQQRATDKYNMDRQRESERYDREVDKYNREQQSNMLYLNPHE